MKNIFVTLTAIGFALVAVTTSAIAAPATAAKATHKTMKSATLTCPACKMPMAQKKSAGAPVAVPIKGKTYYCCATCAAGKKWSQCTR